MDSRKHYFFDLDGTLTESRSLITPEMTDALKTLAQKADVTIISGAELQQMEKQIPWIMDGTVIAMAQSGNDARGYWENKLNDADMARINEHVRCLKNRYVYEGVDENDQIEYRGGQVSFSLLGHNADKIRKKEFDPDGSKRRALLFAVPFHKDGLEVRIGGTTCLDYTRAGWNKAGNIRRLMNDKGWSADNALYVGDGFYKGGNDEIMKDEMVCIEVSGPTRTLEVIEELLKI